MRALLPPAFAELEPFAEAWCLPTETERFNRRLASSMEEILAFYNAFFPRLDEAIELCDQHSVGELPQDVEHLLQLIYSLVMVSMAVEIFGQPKTVDAADAVLLRVREPRP